ncbi:hypothetical protein COCCADRAFT_30254 [Bipolaris zeicola 26-R-13]|uniref:Uncharacterized protein n=1 Tax=Cochliobolus carbonum (strain 26-R-13) TaxID=930089 RepID=W6XT23_COCC2|nr:uncharacterized protein COCCADRAFT_30254 [Bipolaris zeicola 26-R-13]EUC28490.1 hypothetical protein COCCADRAFT_30254 [Bipolaris zeicola 26-R-13]
MSDEGPTCSLLGQNDWHTRPKSSDRHWWNEPRNGYQIAYGRDSEDAPYLRAGCGCSAAYTESSINMTDSFRLFLTREVTLHPVSDIQCIRAYMPNIEVYGTNQLRGSHLYRHAEIRVQQGGSWMEMTRRVVNNACVVMEGNLGATWTWGSYKPGTAKHDPGQYICLDFVNAITSNRFATPALPYLAAYAHAPGKLLRAVSVLVGAWTTSSSKVEAELTSSYSAPDPAGFPRQPVGTKKLR